MASELRTARDERHKRNSERKKNTHTEITGFKTKVNRMQEIPSE